MAKMKGEVSVKLDVLGEWEQPIKDAVRAKMPGAKPSYTGLPMGRAGLVVSWAGFRGHGVAERQEMVRSAIGELGPDATKRITMIVALTPRELAGRNDL